MNKEFCFLMFVGSIVSIVPQLAFSNGRVPNPMVLTYDLIPSPTPCTEASGASCVFTLHEPGSIIDNRSLPKALLEASNFTFQINVSCPTSTYNFATQPACLDKYMLGDQLAYRGWVHGVLHNMAGTYQKSVVARFIGSNNPEGYTLVIERTDIYLNEIVFWFKSSLGAPSTNINYQCGGGSAVPTPQPSATPQ